MKHLKKVIALVLTLVTAFAMATPAFAVEAQETPIKVTGLADGDKAHFYQVIEWVGEAEGNVAGWKAKAPFATYLTKEKLTEILVGTPAVADDPNTTDVDESKPAVAATGITSEVAGEIAKLAEGDGTVIDAVSNEATLANAEPGMWMALIDPADANTIYNPVFVSSDYTAGGTSAGTGDSFKDSVAKKSTLTLEKKAKDETTVDTDDEHTVAIGDTVDFTVTTTIPGYGFVYDNPKFDVTDTLTGLTLVADSIVVKTGTDTLTTIAATNYTVTPESYGGGATYTVSFEKDYLTGLNAATPITITYKAIVNSEAGRAVNEKDNEVTITYSHDPNNQSDYDVKKDTTQHYTFSIDAEGAGEGQSVTGKKTSEVVKVGVKADGTPITETTQTSAITETETWSGPLQGAVFGLFTDEAGTVPYKAKKADGTAGDTAMTATTGADGRMNFAGLDAGTYYLKEISAPAGYVTNSTVHTIVIDAKTKSVKVTETVNGKEVTYDTDILDSYTVTIDGQETAKYTFTNTATASSTDIKWETAELVEHPFELENTKGTELPSTGGMGTKILYTIGGLMVAAGGVFLAAKKRMSTIEE